VIRLPSAIFVATAPIDLHLSFDRLAAIVREQLGGDARADTLVVFHNRRRSHLKLLWHDGSGYRVLYTRLDRGTYRVPLAIPAGASKVQVSEHELHVILEGVDRSLLRAARKSAAAAR
jgi:transposase